MKGLSTMLYVLSIVGDRLQFFSDRFSRSDYFRDFVEDLDDSLTYLEFILADLVELLGLGDEECLKCFNMEEINENKAT